MHILPVIIIIAVILALTGRASNFDQGVAAIGDGAPDKAIALFTKALQKDALSEENKARAYNNRAVAFSRMAQYDRAMADLEASLRLDSDDRGTLQNKQLLSENLRDRRGQASDMARRECGVDAEEPTLAVQEKERTFFFF